jgi:hypothetical protein
MSLSNSWNPQMTYRGQHERSPSDLTTALEDYADGSIVPYYRVYSASRQPNHDYSPRIATAVRISGEIVCNTYPFPSYIPLPRPINAIPYQHRS